MKKITIVWIILGLALPSLVNFAAAKGGGKDAAPPGLDEKGGVPPGQAKKESKNAEKAAKKAEKEAKKAEKDARKQAEKEAEKARDQAEKARKEATKAEKEAGKLAAKEAERAREEGEQAMRQVEKAEKEAFRRAEREARKAEEQQPKLNREERKSIQRQTRLADQVAELNRIAQDRQIQENIFQTIWREHGISTKRLKKQIEENPALGIGDLLVANLISRTVHKPVEEVIALGNSGKEWGEVARDNNVNLPTLIEQTYRVGIVARAVANGGGPKES